MVYGEGWTGGESALPAAQQATKNNIYRLDRVGAFSDDIRDGIKGSVFDFLDKGFVSGKDNMEENIKFSVVAATPHSQVTLTKAGDKCTNWSGQPGQSINYISCHDNLTFWDKLAISNADDSEADRVKMNKLGSAVLLPRRVYHLCRLVKRCFALSQMRSLRLDLMRTAILPLMQRTALSGIIKVT